MALGQKIWFVGVKYLKFSAAATKTCKAIEFSCLSG